MFSINSTKAKERAREMVGMLEAPDVWSIFKLAKLNLFQVLWINILEICVGKSTQQFFITKIAFSDEPIHIHSCIKKKRKLRDYLKSPGKNSALCTRLILVWVRIFHYTHYCVMITHKHSVRAQRGWKKGCRNGNECATKSIFIRYCTSKEF